MAKKKSPVSGEQMLMQKALAPVTEAATAAEISLDEVDDFATAFVIGATEGLAGKDKALNQGGSQVPERIGFYLGITLGPGLKLMFESWLKSQLTRALGRVGW